jgi:hypothetical protein
MVEFRVFLNGNMADIGQYVFSLDIGGDNLLVACSGATIG